MSDDLCDIMTWHKKSRWKCLLRHFSISYQDLSWLTDWCDSNWFIFICWKIFCEKRREIPGFDKSSLLERFSSPTDHRLDRITRVMECQLEGFLVWELERFSRILLRAREHKTVREWSDAVACGRVINTRPTLPPSRHSEPVNTHWWLQRKIQFYIEWKN